MDKGFGWWQWVGPGYGYDGLKGSNYRRISQTNDDNWYIKYGNDFGPSWIDHTTVKNFYFLDNAELPHLLYPSKINPRGQKEWVRMVPGAILTQQQSASGTERVNRLLSDFAGQQITWQDLVKPQPVRLRDVKRVLLCPSSPNCYEYYYNTTQSAWIKRMTELFASKGYTVDVRHKPTRDDRRDTRKRLGAILQSTDYFATVSQHSVSAVESILAGTPAITTGPHPCGNLATPLEQFTSGEIRRPSLEQTEAWIDALLGNTYHKQEIRSGAWYDS